MIILICEYRNGLDDWPINATVHKTIRDAVLHAKHGKAARWQITHDGALICKRKGFPGVPSPLEDSVSTKLVNQLIEQLEYNDRLTDAAD